MSDELYRELINRIERLERKVSDIQSAGVITGLAWNKIPLAQDVRANSVIQFPISAALFEDFDKNSLPSGYSWAGSPFVTPRQVLFAESRIIVYPGAGVRSFLVKSDTSYMNNIVGGLGIVNASNSAVYCGIRIDDGTDNNYAEIVLIGGTSYSLSFAQRTRVGGGTPSVTYLWQNVYAPANVLTAFVEGTPWSNWGLRGRSWYLVPGYFSGFVGSGSGLAFTPQRKGIVFYTVSTSDRMIVDFHY